MGKSRALSEFMLWPFLETEVNNYRAKKCTSYSDRLGLSRGRVSVSGGTFCDEALTTTAATQRTGLH